MKKILGVTTKVIIFAANHFSIPTMIKLSATILTLNEERRIEECLKSLRDIADEIIVVDSGSTDATLEICRRYGCRISVRPMSGFGAQRQYATSLTTHPYVLAIDADEVLSPTLRQNLLLWKRTDPAHRVYAFSRLNFYCGFAVRHCGWYPDIQTRIFDKRYANWNLRNVEERVTFRDSVSPQLIEGDLLHYRCETPTQYADKLRSHAEIRSREIADETESIGSLQPVMRGLSAFFQTYFGQQGFMDGSVGFAIARHNYFASRDAYRHARDKTRTKKQKQ